MISINFKVVRNGFTMCDVTYGNYKSFEDASARISAEVTELANASVGYFSQFNKKMVGGDYRFAWSCSWDSVDEIMENRGFSIGDVGSSFNRDNRLEWNIVVSTSHSVKDKDRYLGME